MSERANDHTFEDYSWTDDERRLHMNKEYPAAPTGSTLSPGLLNKFDHEQNKGWWDMQKHPELPPGVDLAENASRAENIKNPLEFYHLVKGKGDWDLKQQGSQYEPGGNFHFGVVSNAYGIPRRIAKMGAGAYQIYMDTSAPEWGGPDKNWTGDYDPETMRESEPFFQKYKGVLFSPHGDDPRDQEQIDKGYEYYDNFLKKGSGSTGTP
ncbi:MAG: polymorphic toxin type 44 domain-containing protein [Acidobacteriota bacterium]